MMGEFRLVDVISKGEVSDIWQAFHAPSSNPVHIVTVDKRSDPSCYDQQRVQDLERIVMTVDHPNILKYHKILQNNSNFGAIMEFPKGICLREYLLRRGESKRLSEKEARGYFLQILSALDYLHRNFNIVYRNLNLKTVYIDSNGQVKLGDFLICSKGPYIKPTTSSGSYHFFAPESWLEEGKRICPATDIWNLGVILYVMTCGCYPFDGNQEFDIFLSVKKGRFAIPNFLSDECATLIKAMLHPNPEQRPSIASINSGFFTWVQQAQTNRRSPVLTPQSRMRSSFMHGLETIQEEDEEVSPISPVLPRQFGDMNLGNTEQQHRESHPMGIPPGAGLPFGYHHPFGYSNTPNSSPTIQFSRSTPNPSNIIIPPEENWHVNPQRSTRKRPSTDSDMQNIVQNYNQSLETKQQLGVEKASLSIPVGHEASRPKQRRMSCDSIFQSKEVINLLELQASSESQVPISDQRSIPKPTSPFMNPAMEMRFSHGVSSAPQSPKKPRRKRSSSIDSNVQTGKSSTPPPSKVSPTIPYRNASEEANLSPNSGLGDFNNIFKHLPSFGQAEPTPPAPSPPPKRTSRSHSAPKPVVPKAITMHAQAQARAYAQAHAYSQAQANAKANAQANAQAQASAQAQAQASAQANAHYFPRPISPGNTGRVATFPTRVQPRQETVRSYKEERHQAEDIDLARNQQQVRDLLQLPDSTTLLNWNSPPTNNKPASIYGPQPHLSPHELELKNGIASAPDTTLITPDLEAELAAYDLDFTGLFDSSGNVDDWINEMVMK